MCSLIGLGGDHPPTDEEGFVEFARSLRDPVLYEAIEGAKAVSPIHGYREIENKRRHYEKLPSQPDNLLVIGDAACSFNPVYGQGMTTAALGAEILEGCLRGRSGSLSGLSGRFQRRLAKVNAAPWLLATGEDLRVRGAEGGTVRHSTRLTHRYMDRVLSLSLRDLAIRQTFLEVFGMLKPPTALFGPAVVVKLLREELTGRRSAGRREVPGQPRSGAA
jgi:2-polyprenyl-6-methoxyphenol hydroxylase-like FAD-dependent oxidoreductase